MENPITALTLIISKNGTQRIGMAAIILLFLGGLSAWGQYGGYIKLDAGKTEIIITNSGPLGGSQLINCGMSSSEIAAGDICKFQFSIAGLPIGAYPSPSTATCADPCGVSMSTEYGQVAYWYTVRNAADNATIRGPVSMMYLQATQAACSTTPYTVPFPLHGFKGITDCWTVPIAAGVDVATAFVWVRVQNVRNGGSAEILVNGTGHKLKTIDISAVTCDGSACAFTCPNERHGLTAGQVVRLNGFDDMGSSNGVSVASGGGGSVVFNNRFTVASTPTAFTFTITSSQPSGSWNYKGPNASQLNGKTVSASVFCDGELAYYGCLDASDHSMVDLMIPLGATELTANANNILSFRFNGSGDIGTNGLFHGYNVLDAEIVTSFGTTITQIVKSGSSATATLSSPVPADWTIGKTVLIRNARGPYWLFNGKRVLTGVSGSTFSFLCGPDHSGEAIDVAPYDYEDGTYAPMVSNQPNIMQSQTMYASLALIPKANYQYYLSSSDTGPGADAAAGKTFFESAALVDPNPYKHVTLASCASCHPKSGMDLKTFGFSTRSLIVATMHRGGTETDGKNVATRIKALPYPSPARCLPWNPPYQPMKGIDSLPINQWTCGGGWEWVNTMDADMKRSLVPGGSYAAWSGLSNLPIHEIPLHIPLPTWNAWLSTTAPEDFYNEQGADFHTTGMWTSYVAALALPEPVALSSGVSAGATTLPLAATFACSTNDMLMCNDGDEFMKVTAGCGTNSLTVTRAQLSATATTHAIGCLLSDYTKFQASDMGSGGTTFRNSMLANSTYLVNSKAGEHWPSQYGIRQQAAQDWALTRTWEIFNQFSGQNWLDQAVMSQKSATPHARVAPMIKRGHISDVYFIGAAKHRTGYDTASLGLWGNHEVRSMRFFNNQTTKFYHLQNIFNPGNRLFAGNGPVDTQYNYSWNFVPSDSRAAFWLGKITTAFTAQNTLGIATPAAGGCMVPWGWVGGFTAYDKKIDQFASETTDKPAYYENLADMFIEGPVNAFTNANWLTYFNSSSCLPTGATSVVADYSRAYNLTLDNLQDSIAWMLRVMKYYGVTASKLNTIVSWANALYVLSGYDFADDRDNHPCTFNTTNEVPRRLRCP